MKYQVDVTDHALDAIDAAVRYIAVEQQAPLNAKRWLEDLWDKIDSLEQWPRRCPLAEEDRYRAVEIRRHLHHSHLILFTIDDARQKVIVIGLRHTARQTESDAPLH